MTKGPSILKAKMAAGLVYSIKNSLAGTNHVSSIVLSTEAMQLEREGPLSSWSISS